MVVRGDVPASFDGLQEKLERLTQMEIDGQALAAPVKNAVDKFQLVPEFLKARGLVKEHLDSFKYFVQVEIEKIIKANSRITSSGDPSIYLRYKDVRIDEPSYFVDNIRERLTPHRCRLSDKTYAAPIKVDIEYVTGSRDTKQLCTRKNFIIGYLPIMLRSCCCILYGKDEDQLAKYGECPLDPGGYFIIKGTEKVILMQEQLSKNIIIIDTDKKGCVQASVTSSIEKTKSRTSITMEKEKIYLHLNQFASKVPIMIVLKAMGMESNKEVVRMIGRDPQYKKLLRPSIGDCLKNSVETKAQALEFLEQKVKQLQYFTSPQKEGRALNILRDTFLAHVPVHENNFRLKCIYVAVMLRHMMEAIINKDLKDDKNYMGNIRVELSGELLALLFEDLFKSMNEEARITIDRILNKQTHSIRFDMSKYIGSQRITHGFERTLFTGNFDIKRFRMKRSGLTQVLSRSSYIGTLGFITKMNSQFAKSRKVSGPRALHTSQWGMFCPCDTPVGEACGLVKSLALMTHVTTDEDEDLLISLIHEFGVKELDLLSTEELHTPNSYLIMFNGIILGKHNQPQEFAESMRELRRAGKIGEFVSFFVNEKQLCVYIASDRGRVCRPLVIADKGVSRIKEHHMQELKDGVRTFQSFLKEGLIEYLDVNEQNNALIALYEGDAKEGTTHIEIEPFTILGVCAGLIPYPHHNHSPRNTYQCAMGKQAMGNIAYNQLCRLDTLISLLVYPQRPLVTTRTIELVHYDKLGAGQNASVAVMSYSGYDINDAIVMNKSSLDRGFGRCIVMKKTSEVVQKYANGTTDRINTPKRNAPVAENMQILDDDGLAAPGEIIQPFHVLMNKQSPSQYKSSKLITKIREEGETSVVDRVTLFTDENNNMIVNFMTRHTRRPEVGDKFSCRHGQKGICGIIVQQEDIPFSERGVCPDIIINPHGFMSGMTVGKMFELLGGKAGVSCGKFRYGSAFGELSGHADKVEDISETLVKNGFSYSGKDFIYSGITGEPLQAYIFMGPIYYQMSKHMVIDKMHARGCGPLTMMTRQPTEGKVHNGGQRVGEMERDCLIAYGGSMLIYERLMLSSDPFEAQVCRKCGLLGYYHEKLKRGNCSMCKNGDNIVSMKIPYACKLLIQELQSMNIVPRLKLSEAT